MNITINLIEIEQPIGVFYVGKINSYTLAKIYKLRTRNENDGIQRKLSAKRVKEISKYCEDPDATFPTPIILSIDEENIEAFKNLDGSTDIFQLTINDNNRIAEVLDGQHRLVGIEQAKNFNCEIMIVVVFGATEEEKAYIFSTINSNQTKVDRSIIYDLFELSEHRSPYKTCHEIARIMNSSDSSPFHNKLKMLGKKSTDSDVLSQGTFVTSLVTLISKKPNDDMIDIKNNKVLKPDSSCVLRKYFLENKDEVILRILMNYFSAVSDVFVDEWNDYNSYILLKTTGYCALIMTFDTLYKKGTKNKTLTYEFFKQEFTHVKTILDKREYKLDAKTVGLGQAGQKALSTLFLDIIDYDRS